jgi:fructokinase
VIVIGGEALIDLVEEDGATRAVAGGGPFNTAVALGRLEVPVGFLGTLSRDEHGRMLEQHLLDAGVDTSLVRRSEAATPHAVVHRQSDGDNVYTFEVAGTAFADLTPRDLPALPDAAWAVHVGTLALALDPPGGAFEALVEREAGRRRIVLDPNVRPTIFGDPVAYRKRFERIARLADIVKLSDDDAAWIYPGLATKELLEAILALGPRLVVVTRGAQGAAAASREAYVEAPGLAVEVADTVGAGDTFGAALLAALVDADAFGPVASAALDATVLRRALSYAVIASAITCTRTGADPPSRSEIAAQLASDEAGIPV